MTYLAVELNIVYLYTMIFLLGEDGNAMPDLERPVHAVSQAVTNLVRVGKDTITSSQDSKLKNEMPKSLNVIGKNII